MRAAMAERYLDAQASAATCHFRHNCLTSRSLSPSALLNNLKYPGSGATVRNIGDFPDHRKHVFVNSCNALLSGCLGNIPDWAPVQSTKKYGAFHLAARAISGGPIQISSFDNGYADKDLIQRICGRTALNRLIALRPSSIAATTMPYVAFEDPTLLKIGNIHCKFNFDCHIACICNLTPPLSHRHHQYSHAWHLQHRKPGENGTCSYK